MESGHKVFVIMRPEIFGFEVKEAFQIITGVFLKETHNDVVLVKIFIEDSVIKETIYPINKKLVFVNIKQAIDCAYEAYNREIKKDKDELDSRPTNSDTTNSELVGNQE